MKRLLLAAGFFCLAAAAQAQLGEPPNPDLDRDGKVTFGEFKKAQADAMLARMDANRDGKIARAELKGHDGEAPGGARKIFVDRMWGRMDVDRDGALSRVEIETAAKFRFDRADTNKDGWLSKGEILAQRQNRGRDAG
jgi:hypothetical protein